MDEVWEQLHGSREWGKYPSVDLVKTVLRQYKPEKAASIKVLEIGCGAGANLSFFVKEGFNVVGLDGSNNAIKNAQKNLNDQYSNKYACELFVADFESLPCEEETFDIVVDNLAVYANTVSVIKKSYEEAYRVLKPGGHIYSRVWGTECQGYNSGVVVEEGTSLSPEYGPCQGMGTTHFFAEKEFMGYFDRYQQRSLRCLTEQCLDTGFFSEEWVMWARK